MYNIYFYLILIVFLYFIFTRVLENFLSQQENFDPSLVPVSSIINLAKTSQKLINGNGTLNSNLQIGASTGAPGNLTVTGNTFINGTPTTTLGGKNTYFSPSYSIAKNPTNITFSSSSNANTISMDNNANMIIGGPSPTALGSGTGNLTVIGNTTIGGSVSAPKFLSWGGTNASQYIMNPRNNPTNTNIDPNAFIWYNPTGIDIRLKYMGGTSAASDVFIADKNGNLSGLGNNTMAPSFSTNKYNDSTATTRIEFKSTGTDYTSGSGNVHYFRGNGGSITTGDVEIEKDLKVNGQILGAGFGRVTNFMISGIRIQSGIANGSAGQFDIPITFPVAFNEIPNVVIFATSINSAVGGSGNQNGLRSYNVKTTGFNACSDANGALNCSIWQMTHNQSMYDICVATSPSLTVNWIAIGKSS